MPNQIKIRPLKDKLRQFFSPIVYECSIFRNNGKPIGGFADENEIADAFSPTHSYVVGEPCIYENVVRICTTPHNGDWDASHFRSTSVMGYAQELSQNLTDLAWGTAIEITRNIVAGYVFEVPAMGVIAGEFRKTANTNNGSIDIRSNCGITYKFLASVPPINGGYTPIHINVVRGEKITFRQFAEINFSDSHIWFQPYVRRS